MAEVTYQVVTGNGVEYRSFDAPQEFVDWLVELQADHASLAGGGS